MNQNSDRKVEITPQSWVSADSDFREKKGDVGCGGGAVCMCTRKDRTTYGN